MSEKRFALHRLKTALMNAKEKIVESELAGFLFVGLVMGLTVIAIGHILHYFFVTFKPVLEHYAYIILELETLFVEFLLAILIRR